MKRIGPIIHGDVFGEFITWIKMGIGEHYNLYSQCKILRTLSDNFKTLYVICEL